ncbi:MAG TPA: hypothetical protein PLN55_09925 [Burkholderiaceae bacterium]|nr:hypothetical protein [Burkholderiaceae bacterium]
MIRHDLVTSTLRFYASEEPGPFEPYVAICTLLWETDNIVWIAGLHGSLSRKLLRELVEKLHGLGVSLAKAHRHPAHRLPFGVEVDDHIEMDVATMARRAGLA